MVMPYLHFDGNCEEAFRFYAECFGSGDVVVDHVGGRPDGPVMHAQVKLGEYGCLAGNDARYEREVRGMQILVLLPCRERIEELCAALSVGGALISGFNTYTPDGEDGGAEVLDRYGYTWFLCT